MLHVSCCFELGESRIKVSSLLMVSVVLCGYNCIHKEVNKKKEFHSPSNQTKPVSYPDRSNTTTALKILLAHKKQQRFHSLTPASTHALQECTITYSFASRSCRIEILECKSTVSDMCNFLIRYPGSDLIRIITHRINQQ